jgi:hypothetical protein
MTDSTASEAARLLGRITSAKKAAASRENGKRGGRPRKKYPAGMNYQFNDARTPQPQPVTIILKRKAVQPVPLQFDPLDQREEGDQ